MTDTARQQQTLHRVGELTAMLMERAYARAEAVEGADWVAAAGLFEGLARGVRLTIALELRLLAFEHQQSQVAQRIDTYRQRPERDRPEVGRPEVVGPAFMGPEVVVSGADPREREREAETETDGYAATPLGRIAALQSHIAAAPDLDPDRRVGAEIIELKAFLAGPPPPKPSGPPAQSDHPAAEPGFGRPLNRAERRRLRRSSG